MANKPITPANLPNGDIPTDWVNDDIVSADGMSVGKDEKYGYNYQAEQLKKAAEGVIAINNAFAGLLATSDKTNLVEASSEANAMTLSTQNPNNIYYVVS